MFVSRSVSLVLLSSSSFFVTCIDRNQTYVKIVTLHKRRFLLSLFVICWLLKTDEFVKCTHLSSRGITVSISYASFSHWSYACTFVVFFLSLNLRSRCFGKGIVLEIFLYRASASFRSQFNRDLFIWKWSSVFGLLFFFASNVVILLYSTYDTWV